MSIYGSVCLKRKLKMWLWAWKMKSCTDRRTLWLLELWTGINMKKKSLKVPFYWALKLQDSNVILKSRGFVILVYHNSLHLKWRIMKSENVDNVWISCYSYTQRPLDLGIGYINGRGILPLLGSYSGRINKDETEEGFKDYGRMIIRHNSMLCWKYLQMQKIEIQNLL